MLGAEYAAERCDQLVEAFGDRFACPDLLREMAAKGQTFYGRFSAGAKAA
jgi:3-hydroxyacyl-CoA dehydrogenase/enoyl-CoA hydratase/3-hydroxybutyryl-CoA epimerase